MMGTGVAGDSIDRLRNEFYDNKYSWEACNFEMEFKPALKAAVLAFEQLQKTKRMSAEKRSALEEKNKERRRKAYIARMMREQAQQKVQPKQEEQ